MSLPSVCVRHESWPLARPFVIARGAITEVEVVVVEITRAGCTGRGESCPVPHYGESTAGVLAQVTGIAARISTGESWNELHDIMPAGAARNAVDCAIWDLQAKELLLPVWHLAGLPQPKPVDGLYTIGIGAPGAMAEAARQAAVQNPILKVKLGAAGDRERIRAVRDAVPASRLIADANEAWSPDELAQLLPVLAECRFELIEQPLPAGKEEALAEIEHAIPICADESCHTSADLERIADYYDAVNIKLDKTGGLTEAIRLQRAAQNAGLETMVGCMLGTSLAMAPALLIAQSCRYADLDAPLLIGSDREHALRYESGLVFPPEPQLWG